MAQVVSWVQALNTLAQVPSEGVGAKVRVSADGLLLIDPPTMLGKVYRMWYRASARQSCTDVQALVDTVVGAPSAVLRDAGVRVCDRRPWR